MLGEWWSVGGTRVSVSVLTARSAPDLDGRKDGEEWLVERRTVSLLKTPDFEGRGGCCELVEVSILYDLLRIIWSEKARAERKSLIQMWRVKHSLNVGKRSLGLQLRSKRAGATPVEIKLNRNHRTVSEPTRQNPNTEENDT